MTVGSHRQAVEYMTKLHDVADQAVSFLEDWTHGDIAAVEARWPDFVEWIRREPDTPEACASAMLDRDCRRMRRAGTVLAEAALYTVREYDGVHRLSLAVSGWAKAVADEGDRARSITAANTQDGKGDEM